ncbi:endonuclease [Flavobacterium sp.]|uniref:endonuclease n=1 Tax=Flavobacterium sp. TaxID=239 RepID=UPI00286E8324|nr:endonuclease [Flavobacterium sp.]
MKLKLLLTAFLFSIISFAQIPNGYYTTATGTGYTLKTQLYNIIKGHFDRGYDGLYVTYQTSDRDYYYENDGTILDMYSENPTGADPYNYSTSDIKRCGNYSKEGDCYNREHIIPQSVFGENTPMVSDAHFIPPTDGVVNNIRSNLPHGIVSTVSKTTLNKSKLGSSGVAGYSGTVFEPIDEFKGDIARMYFYFATRYENTVAGYSYTMFNKTSNQVFTEAFLNMLVTWHEQDPVNAREIARNNAIYARQNNRNPYIDHPEWVRAIWGSALGKEIFGNLLANVSVYPNPSKSNKINIETESELDKIQLITINGQMVQKIDHPKANQKVYTLENLKQGVYFLKLDSFNKSMTKKVIIN